MDQYFIRMKVVEDDINNEQEFLQEFKSRCDAKAFPIVIKIDEAPDITRLTLGGKPLIEFITRNEYAEHIIVEIDNLVQQVPGIDTRKWFNELPFFHFKDAEAHSKNLQKKFMLFVGNHRWPRFILAEHMHRYHQQDTYLTYWHKDFGTENLSEHLPSSRIDEFTQQLPIHIDTTEKIQKHHDGYINFTDTNALEEFYHKSFCDLVCETWHMGDTFLPTEKIARPLALKNPFIVYGPKHFLRNLRRLGFKTFGNYWSEDYDQCEGAERISLIKSQIDFLADKSIDQLQTMLSDMADVLEHNKQLYQNIELESINTEFSCRLT